MRILRYPTLNEDEFAGCVAAFADSLSSAVEATRSFLNRLRGSQKGSAFAFEMQLDQSRYGLLLILARWTQFLDHFGSFFEAGKYASIVEQPLSRIQSAEDLIRRMNDVIDSGEDYGPDIQEAVRQALDALDLTFRPELEAATSLARLGPMLPDATTETRRVFLADLGAR